MGSFVFIWPNAGEEVFVTGTFDDWSKSAQLEKVGDVFQKTVELKDASKKIYYKPGGDDDARSAVGESLAETAEVSAHWQQQASLVEKPGEPGQISQSTPLLPNLVGKFVVDGEWVLDPAAPQEKDEEGNDNNVLTPENIVATAASTTVISSAAPEATTAQLAAVVPLEEKTVETPVETPVVIQPAPVEPVVAEETPASAAIISSVAPVSTTAALAAGVPLEEKKEETPAAVEETPAPEEPAAPKETSTAADIAAPVTAAAAGVAAVGAAVIATAKSSTDNAKNMSADKSDEIPGTFPDTPASELNKEVKLINPLPAAPGGVNPVTLAPGEKIPDSLKTGDINANVKLDPESYEKADAAIAGDFSAEQLPPVSKNLIPESSLPIAGSNDVTINSVAPVATTAALAGAVPLEKNKTAAAAAPVETETVPEIVKESQEAAGVAPEASAIPEEVKEKEQVEQELLKKVPEAPATSEGATTTKSSTSPVAIVGGVAAAAATLGAAALATATTAKDKAVEQAGPAYEKATASATDAASKLPVSVKQVLPVAVQEQLATTAATGGETVTSDVPAEVKESIQEAGTSPEAAANATAVEEKKAVEAQLLKKVDSGAPAEAASAAPAAESSSAAPAAATESAAAAPAAEAAAATNGKDSAPAVVAAPAPASVPHVAPIANPAAAAIASASSTPPSKAGVVTADKKKKNRLSGFFHKILDKIDGDKKK